MSAEEYGKVFAYRAVLLGFISHPNLRELLRSGGKHQRRNLWF